MPIKMNDREYRRIDAQLLQTRSAEDGDMIVEGYATTFNQPYELFRDGAYIVREQVDPNAFTDTDMRDVIMQYDHEGRVFARVRNNTLELSCDEHGLHIRAHLGGTEIGRQLYEEIRGGYTDRMSFGFTVEEEKRDETRNESTGEITILRTITKVRKLYDVSAVSLPANDATEISARSWGEGVIAEAMKEVRAADAELQENTEEATPMSDPAEPVEALEERAAELEADEPAEAMADEAASGETPQDAIEETRDEDEPDEEPDELESEPRTGTAPETPEAASAADEEVRANMAAMEARNAVAEGRGTVIETHNYEEEKTMTIDEIRSSTEYVDAFAKYLRTNDDRECRALLKTENASGYVPVPVMVDDIIRHAWDSEEILSRVKKTSFRGNLKVAFEKAGDNAYVHTEGTTAPTEESLELGIVTMTPANIKKWIHITDEDVTMGGEAFVRYIYEELAYQITKKLAALVIGDITALDTSNQTTSVGAARITAAPSLTVIAEAFANLSDEARDPVVIMNKLTYANFQAAYAAGNFGVDPFHGFKVLFNNTLPAYDTATGGTDDYCIVGDLSGAQVNYPEGEGLVIKWDDISEAEKDLVKVVGRQYVAHAVTAPFRFTRIKKPSAATT